MAHKLQDINRRNISFSKSAVKEVLPEYFVESYPNIVLFLEKYYEYLEDENTMSFKTEINNLFLLRDPGQTTIAHLDYLIEEVGNGLKSSSFFQNPRLMVTLLANFYRVKGSLLSLEGFFRGFFGQEVVIEYPKKKMFVVGDSPIGFEGQKFIQNNELYQIFSILIKSSLALSEWQDLYVKFVHPAGFYFAGEVVLENAANFSSTTFSENPLSSISTNPVAIGTAAFSTIGQYTAISALYDSDRNSSNEYRVNVEHIEDYQTMTLAQLGGLYTDVAEFVQPTSFTFDLDSNIDMSINLETFDNDVFDF